MPLPGATSASASSSGGGGAPALLQVLQRPYVRAPGALVVSALKAWLADRLAGKRWEGARLPALQLRCGGQPVGPDMTLLQIQQQLWKKGGAGADGGGGAGGGGADDCATPDLGGNAASEVMVVFYSFASSVAAKTEPAAEAGAQAPLAAYDSGSE